MMTWWNRFLTAFRPEPRVSGEPPSGNGASSFHLWWRLPYGERLTAAKATLEIVDPPTVDRLHFWALQVSFVRPAGGGAHLGLQHNRRHPGSGAANWGGYAPDGTLLQGSPSVLPSAPDDTNTRDFGWIARRQYLLRIDRADGARSDGRFVWRGSITDLSTGKPTVVRELWSEGAYLRGPVVWTESFARCEHPPVAVRWSELAVTGEDGDSIAVSDVSVNYQRHEAGGCANTDVFVDGDGWVQRTSTTRTSRSGRVLSLTR